MADLRSRPLLTWVLDDANKRDAAAVVVELPEPAPFRYRHVRRRRLAAPHWWQVEPVSKPSWSPITAFAGRRR